MAENIGFAADVQTLDTLARTDLPEVADSLARTTTPMREMTTDPAAVFGSKVTEAKTLGEKYNETLDALTRYRAALAGSLATAATSLQNIAATYDSIDRTLAGR